MKPRPKKRPKYLKPGTIIIIKQIFWGVLVFISVGLIITAIWYGTRLSSFTINKVTVEGGVTINKEIIKNKAEDLMVGSYFHLIPKRFAYTYPDSEILDSINQVSKIKNVKVARVSGSELKITFDEYLPDTLWCDLHDQTKCYFLDKTGYAFAAAPTLSGGSLTRYFTTEKDTEIGVSPLSLSDYEATKEFVRKMADIGWYISKVEVDSTRDVFYALAQGGEVKATLTEDQEKPFANLVTIIQSKEFSHLKPGNFKYLDLRFGSRAFVNEELEAPDEEPAPTDMVEEENATTTEEN